MSGQITKEQTWTWDQSHGLVIQCAKKQDKVRRRLAPNYLGLNMFFKKRNTGWNYTFRELLIYHLISFAIKVLGSHNRLILWRGTMSHNEQI